MEQFDVAIIGGGIAGLSAAARLGTGGRRVALIDPGSGTAGADRRTTAVLQPSIDTLDRAGAWAAMVGAGAPLRVMRIVDAGGRVRQPRETADFSGAETAGELFGFNVPNTAARAALLVRLDAMDNVSTVFGTAVTGLLARTEHAVLRLSCGTRIAARLAVAADGRDSAMRGFAGIGARRWRYGQSALVFHVRVGSDLDGVSTEIHRTGGPLTLVPLPPDGDEARAAVVWLVPDERAASLQAMDDTRLAAELTAETMGLFGPLEIATPRACWPMISQVAHRLRGERVALIAEAAHVMPPIGAQGLNTSLLDIEALAELIEPAPDPGHARLLARYEAAQMPTILAKVAGIDLLNRAAMTESQPMRDLRVMGLRAINRIAPLRGLAIRAGMGG